jgi:hypothetical protein
MSHPWLPTDCKIHHHLRICMSSWCTMGRRVHCSNRSSIDVINAFCFRLQKKSDILLECVLTYCRSRHISDIRNLP